MSVSTVKQTLGAVAGQLEQLPLVQTAVQNPTKTRIYAGGVVGGAVGYMTSTGIVAGAACGAGAAGSFPICYMIVDKLEPTASKTEKVFHSGLAALGAGYFLVHAVSWVAGVATGIVIVVAIPTAYYAYYNPEVRQFLIGLPKLLCIWGYNLCAGRSPQ